ncbi:unnamed protein product [Caenorhabditis angaria]|uniref:DUF281 domain-containing protein n=1 Tax=Caenorhabditis angaria TaxID=860376 RepID=A0A9P1N585_9PELO|nr:unnamed protein product [Caenorhabditis angaria]
MKLILILLASIYTASCEFDMNKLTATNVWNNVLAKIVEENSDVDEVFVSNFNYTICNGKTFDRSYFVKKAKDEYTDLKVDIAHELDCATIRCDGDTDILQFVVTGAKGTLTVRANKFGHKLRTIECKKP